MTPLCNQCQAQIPATDVNVGNDVAFCRKCNQAWKLSDLVHGTSLDPSVDLNHPPEGTWFRSSITETTIGASHRSLGMAIGTLLICLFWNSIVSVFVLVNVSATLHHLGMTLPAWAPEPKMNGGPMSVGMTLSLWLFLTPFILIGLTLLGAFLTSLAGRTEVALRHSEGTLFTGIGPIGWRKKFHRDEVKDVRLDQKRWVGENQSRQSEPFILVERIQGKPLRFGSQLTEERRNFLAAALRKTLLG